LLAGPAVAGSCWCRATSQESTQLINKAKLIQQLEEQVRMVKNQLKMLEKLSGSMVSGLKGANTLITNQFDKIIDTWKDSMSLTHVMDNFEDMHRKRHPERQEGVPINAEIERQRRDKEWEEMVSAYLKGLNMKAKDLNNSAAARQKLMEVLQSSEGQVQAIQALGGMVDHTAMILEQNGQVASGMMTLVAEKELDRRNQENDEKQNWKTAIDGMDEFTKPTGKGHTIDINSTK